MRFPEPWHIYSYLWFEMIILYKENQTVSECSYQIYYYKNILDESTKKRQEYIKKLVEDYGYSPDQMAQEIKVNNSQRGQGKARADIVIWKSKQDKIESKAAFIVVECKAENVRIREEDYYQGYIDVYSFEEQR